MTKINVISGFLGAGKTTLIKKLLKESFSGEKVVLIENEFGEIGIDGGFLKDAGVQITEMNSGCICCSLVGDFGKALSEVITKFSPDRIIIEPSGVGKLSDVVKAVVGVAKDMPVELDSSITVADVNKCKMYIKNFGEFFNNQIEHADTIVLSRTQTADDAKVEAAVALLKEHNPNAAIITTPWDSLNGNIILEAMNRTNSLAKELLEEEEVCPVCGGHHHDHDDDECGCEHDHDEHEHHHHDHDDECGCEHDHDEHEHHHHDHDDECGCDHDHDEHEHHHHDHDDECGCEHDHDEHEHHHDHDDECGCGHDHHHHHHHADEVFTSWGKETPHKYNKDDMDGILKKLANTDEYGQILRAKGIVPATDGTFIYFDLVPGEYELREGTPDYTGKLCVIGSNLKEDALAELFQLA